MHLLAFRFVFFRIPLKYWLKKLLCVFVVCLVQMFVISQIVFHIPVFNNTLYSECDHSLLHLTLLWNMWHNRAVWTLLGNHIKSTLPPKTTYNTLPKIIYVTPVWSCIFNCRNRTHLVILIVRINSRFNKTFNGPNIQLIINLFFSYSFMCLRYWICLCFYVHTN